MSEKESVLIEKKEDAIKWYGYALLIVGIVFFSGILKSMEGPLKALDFNTVLGTFGKLGDLSEGTGSLAADFKGKGGVGIRDGFLMALTVMPTVMLALGVVSIIERYDGLRAAQKMLSPILKPILGIPGISGLAMISSFQSADAGAAMTNSLHADGLLTDNEKHIFVGFQYTGGGTITNFFLCGASLFIFLDEVGIPMLLPMMVIFAGKVLSANAIRLYEYKFNNGGAK